MKISVIGSGQQGASIARALNDSGHDIHIHDISEDALNTFATLDNTDHVTTNAEATDAFQDADVIILATPIDTFAPIIKENSDFIKRGAIISDIGSGKVKSIESITKVLPERASYVPVHPINGKSKPGPEQSDIAMYQGQTIVMIPGHADEAPSVTIQSLWEMMGGEITEMDAQTHDQLYGTISHFEHVVAFALTASLEDENNPGHASDDFKNGGQSLLATTRISGGSADMWIPIFQDNKDAILAAANGFREELKTLKAALNSDGVKTLVQEAHDYRVQFQDHDRESVAAEHEDFRLKAEFNDASGLSLARQITISVAVGLAITRNAMQIDEKLRGVAIKDVANPSFKDGSAPMLSDPTYLASLLEGDKDALITQIDKFTAQFDALVGHIEHNQPSDLKAYIERVNSIRADGVPKKADPETVRPEHSVKR